MTTSEVSEPALIQLGDGVYICKSLSAARIPGSMSIRVVVGKGEQEVAQGPGISTEVVSPPNIIILFPWLGAKLPHILKYVQSYRIFYPSATQIIVRSEPASFWNGDKAKRSYFAPVVEALEVLGCLPDTQSSSLSPTLLSAVRAAHIERIIDTPSPKVLVHAFSNGGSWQLTTLSAILAESYPPSLFRPTSFQASIVVLDSCPGNGGVSRTVAAFSSAIRSPLLRALVGPAVRGAFLLMAARTRLTALFHILRTLLRRLLQLQTPSVPPAPPQTTIDALKTTLSSPRLLPWLTAATPRLYMYSPFDEMIPAEEVEAHAADAERQGLCVRMELFPESSHVAHARMYPERYWAVITETWAATSAELKVKTDDFVPVAYT
ncbi:hypothetical protein HYPSUDRAFT_38107 [Hypholoma sublateritium FD-334 SS-4]|uniref:Uncharacterized protein n=1 Tax=Hypholoma sublateritium (strain FD-334 SS-4) TaxID=945553 RepID=A0A0D2MMI1_HYPSF|nr:hypothetical protein HYPSUDRAFT_38107 [Hypholoma sublateritium FD-334 SS-4]